MDASPALLLSLQDILLKRKSFSTYSRNGLEKKTCKQNLHIWISHKLERALQGMPSSLIASLCELSRESCPFRPTRQSEKLPVPKHWDGHPETGCWIKLKARLNGCHKARELAREHVRDLWLIVWIIHMVTVAAFRTCFPISVKFPPPAGHIIMVSLSGVQDVFAGILILLRSRKWCSTYVSVTPTLLLVVAYSGKKN